MRLFSVPCAEGDFALSRMCSTLAPSTLARTLGTLLEAFRQLKHEIRFRNFKLVKVGRAGGSEVDFRANTLRTIRALELEGDVILQDLVSKSDLVSFYSQAELFAFPSLYEGFGWPVRVQNPSALETKGIIDLAKCRILLPS